MRNYQKISQTSDKRCCVDGCENRYVVVNPQKFCSKHYSRWRKHGDPTTILRAENGAGIQWIKDHVGYAGDECLIWPFGRYHGKYGQLTHEGKKHIASRLMCEIAYGPPPEPGMDCAHSCGNGHLGCTNPRHLRWATHKENMADRLLHGSDNRGERHGNAKLTKEAVREMRRIYKSGRATQQQLADRFGIHSSHVSAVVRGAAWSWL